MGYVSELADLRSGQTPQGILGLERLLRAPAEGRSFTEGRVSLDVLEALRALMAVGPGMAGASPVHLMFVATPAAKLRLAQRLAPWARDAAVLAPVCAVIGYDRAFAEQLLVFAGDGVAGESCFDRAEVLRATAMRNGVLQGAYLALSARALGLEAAFLHGFDGAAVAAEFFGAKDVSAIFVAALGYPKRPNG